MPDFSTVIWVGFGLALPFLLVAFVPANRRYRCDICGVEVRLTMAPDQDPPPPRHCLEDMTEIAPLYD